MEFTLLVWVDDHGWQLGRAVIPCPVLPHARLRWRRSCSHSFALFNIMCVCVCVFMFFPFKLILNEVGQGDQ